jgi:hypothetical protein
MAKIIHSEDSMFVIRVTSVVVNNDTDDYAGCREQYSRA